MLNSYHNQYFKYKILNYENVFATCKGCKFCVQRRKCGRKGMCKRLKFENILIVVLLLLAHMCIASLHDYSKVAKYYWKTQVYKY